MKTTQGNGLEKGWITGFFKCAVENLHLAAETARFEPPVSDDRRDPHLLAARFLRDLAEGRVADGSALLLNADA